MKTSLISFLILLCPLFSPAQGTSDMEEVKLEYQQSYDEGVRYIASSLFADGIASLNKAIELAKTNELKEEFLQASIELAETMRKTGDFSQGIEILMALGDQPDYPLQEVKKLGRLAAIYHEFIKDEPQAQFDSVTKYLNPAIKLATENDFQIELAGLKNEYGYLLSRHKSWREGLPYHQEAAAIYFANGEKQNYVGVMTKVLTLLIQNTRDYGRIDSLSQVLMSEVKDQGWYTAETELYGTISQRYAGKGDEADFYKWRVKSVESMLNYVESIHTKELDNMRVSYETQKFQAKAEENAQMLSMQRERNRNLIIYLSVVGILMLTIGFLFFRERKTKRAIDQINQDLKIANDKYHMLMVESNHRIKNNLQMIISMLEYTGKDVSPENTRALKRMSGKIHTISALHKHLYADVHNARVDLAIYFNEIITLYTDLSAGNLTVHNHFVEVGIQSERLVYFGLIFNEMLSNTMEHKVADQKQVYVNTTKHEEGYYFEYRDDSVYTNEGQEGTGMLLIRQLISRIGGQNLQFDPMTGTYKFQFDA